MKSTNAKAYKDAVKAYLLPLINEMAAENGEHPANPFKWILERAKSEVPHEFSRRGEQAGLEYWLSGLGLSGLDFYYCDIIGLAEAWHDCELKNNQKEKVCDLWFRHLACKIIQFSNE